LLGFLLAFITGLAANRFDHRRALVLSEANAIGTTWLRAGFLDAPIGEESRALLRDYVDMRLAALDPARRLEARTRSEEIHRELWSRAEAAARARPDSEVVALYIQALNEVIDVHTMRVVAVLSSRIPSSIWLGVIVVVILTMVLVGLHSSYGERENWPGLILLTLVFAAVFTLIIDLDRPTQGMLQVNQQALFDLREQLREGDAGGS